MESESIKAVKSCANCGEIMPLYVKVCYCGGPIKLIKVSVDKAKLADSYMHRMWLFRRQQCGY